MAYENGFQPKEPDWQGDGRGSGGNFPWLVAPRNAEEYAWLKAKVIECADEFADKSVIIGAEIKARVRHPKRESKWGALVAAMRLDLRFHADAVGRPLAQAAAGFIAGAKGWKLSWERYLALYTEMKNRARARSGGNGWDFGG